MLNAFGVFFAALGAGAILAALTFVTLLIGVLVNSMAALLSGPILDKSINE